MQAVYKNTTNICTSKANFGVVTNQTLYVRAKCQVSRKRSSSGFRLVLNPRIKRNHYARRKKVLPGTRKRKFNYRQNTQANRIWENPFISGSIKIRYRRLMKVDCLCKVLSAWLKGNHRNANQPKSKGRRLARSRLPLVRLVISAY